MVPHYAFSLQIEYTMLQANVDVMCESKLLAAQAMTHRAGNIWPYIHVENVNVRNAVPRVNGLSAHS
jgi:hypothetical protein